MYIFLMSFKNFRWPYVPHLHLPLKMKIRYQYFANFKIRVTMPNDKQTNKQISGLRVTSKSWTISHFLNFNLI